MGHVMAIRRYGFQASASMFIPGFGALIQLRTFRPFQLDGACRNEGQRLNPQVALLGEAPRTW
ncbi:MAG: hypothetical protein DMG58_36005 [Acidobacteria bacterium]|nr:MAG: hypothetical protein DMG58_36005 [Acidobacteriota bacterium]